MMLSVKEREDLIKAVQKFFVKNSHWKKVEIINHFLKEGYKESTLYNVLYKFQNESSIKDKKRTGRQSSWTPVKLKRLERLAKVKIGASQRKLRYTFLVNQRTIGRKLPQIGRK